MHVPYLMLAEGSCLDDHGAALIGAQVDERYGGTVGAQSGYQRGDVGRESGAFALLIEVAYLGT